MLERLKKARNDLGLTQAEFAEKLGMTLNAYNLIENGKRELLDRHIKAICAIFGISEDWLRGLHGYEEFDNKGLSNELMKIACTLTEKDQKSLLDYANFLYKQQVENYDPNNPQDSKW